VVDSHVLGERASGCIRFTAEGALEGPLSRVDPNVLGEVATHRKRLGAECTFEGLLSRMCADVHFAVFIPSKLAFQLLKKIKNKVEGYLYFRCACVSRWEPRTTG
jgi:hypothetical protein